MRGEGYYEVLGLGGPLMDRLMRVSDAFIEKLNGIKGGAEAVDLSRLDAIAKETGAEEVLVPGGATANTIKGLALLGQPCALLGKAGRDRIGEYYLKRLADLNIHSLVTYGEGPSGQVLCLITPDGERTQRPFPGASGEITPAEVREEHLRPARLVILEGFAFRNRGLLQHTVKVARACGCTIALGASAYEIVEEYRSDFDELFAMDAVDILFTNADEARALTGCGPEEAVELLAERCPMAIVTMGKEGCVVKSREERVRYKGAPVRPVDTTGAGDLFAAGFLHGVLQERPLTECAMLGCLMGGAVTQHIGPEIPEHAWAALPQMLRR